MPIEYRPNPSKDLEAEWRRAGWTDLPETSLSLDPQDLETELSRIAIRGLNGDHTKSDLFGGIFSYACLDNEGQWYLLPIQSVIDHRVSTERVR